MKRISLPAHNSKERGTRFALTAAPSRFLALGSTCRANRFAGTNFPMEDFAAWGRGKVLSASPEPFYDGFGVIRDTQPQRSSDSP
jgi:hypothetical protein